jgi:hypothetical protein
MKISTQAKLISTALVALTIAAPIARGETGGTSVSGYPQLKTGEGFSFEAPSYWNAGPSYWSTAQSTGAATPSVGMNHSLGVPPQYLGTGIKTEPRTARLGEGFSFKAPSYWNAAPSYWRTVELTLTPRAPRASVNRSLGVPPQYLGGGTKSVARTTPVSVNRSLGVPPQYLGSTTQQVSTASSGFDWLDAGVGAAFVAVLGALGLGVFVAVRRRYGLAHLEV